MGNVWVFTTRNGLLIIGDVLNRKPDWPQFRSGILGKDHVEVWLAWAPKVAMPPIGFGGEDGWAPFVELTGTGPKDCRVYDGEGSNTPCDEDAQERGWYTEVVKYRSLFSRLFTRQWLVVPDHVTEDFATAAYAGIKSGFFPDFLPTALEPRTTSKFPILMGTPIDSHPDEAGRLVTAQREIGYKFQVEIPYSEFPPMQQLDIKDLWLMVDVFGAAPADRKMGSYSTTALHRVWGNPESFNHVQIEKPRIHALGPCAVSLQRLKDEPDAPGGKTPQSWYIPGSAKKDGVVDTDYAVTNAYDEQQSPSGPSPIFEKTQHFGIPAGKGAFVCGPRLAYRKGPLLSAWPDADGESALTTEGLAAKVLADGWTLVKNGPFDDERFELPHGTCGGCPYAHMDVYAISPEGKITKALEIFDKVGYSLTDVDFDIAPDWSRIIYFTQEIDPTSDQPDKSDDGWRSQTYCLTANHVYQKCGEPKESKPPQPRKFTME